MSNTIAHYEYLGYGNKEVHWVWWLFWIILAWPCVVIVAMVHFKKVHKVVVTSVSGYTYIRKMSDIEWVTFKSHMEIRAAVSSVDEDTPVSKPDPHAKLKEAMAAREAAARAPLSEEEIIRNNIVRKNDIQAGWIILFTCIGFGVLCFMGMVVVK